MMIYSDDAMMNQKTRKTALAGLRERERERERTFNPDALSVKVQYFHIIGFQLTAAGYRNETEEGRVSKRWRERERGEGERRRSSDPQNDQAFHRLTSSPRRTACAFVCACTIHWMKRSPEPTNWFIAISQAGVHMLSNTITGLKMLLQVALIHVCSELKQKVLQTYFIL